VTWVLYRCGENLVTPVWFNCLTGFSHLLLIGNASTNFLIYCSLRWGQLIILVHLAVTLAISPRFMVNPSSYPDQTPDYPGNSSYYLNLPYS
jgi:hypothetical protein